jgi:hypothetical protein
MSTRALVSLLLIITPSGCADLQRQADDYDTSILARALSLCDKEMWVSREADERLCVRRSNWDHNTFLMTQDFAEYWADTLVTLAANYYIPLLGSALYADDDTTEKWRRAADHYMRKHYGAKAEIVAFKKLEEPMGYIFQVKPGDQVPSWKRTETPEFVLASQWIPPAWQEPDKYSYAATGNMIEKPHHYQSGRPQTLTAMVQKALKSSRPPGRANILVRGEERDPMAYRRHLAALRSAPRTSRPLTK